MLNEVCLRNSLRRLPTDLLRNSYKRINERNKTQRSLMADDLRGYDAAIDADNVGEKVAAWMVEIIQTTAGLVKQDELEKQNSRSKRLN